MAIITGNIESLERLKEKLKDNGITRFNSIGDIKSFLKNYQAEKEAIYPTNKIALDKEIYELNEAIQRAAEKQKINVFYKIVYGIASKFLRVKTYFLEKNYEKILSKRCAERIKQLDFAKETVDSLYPLIAGAVGEHLTVKELEKLSNDYYLINDLSIDFNPPIFNKNEGDRIFSIQIDHLLISKSGVFLLETKNWSNESIKNSDFRSPVKQILRTSYAIFILLNSRSSVSLVRRHWGSVRIPIRNIIVMINAKPREEFKHVKILNLSELNGYIQYFEDVFSTDEVRKIFDYFNRLCVK